MVPIGSGHQPNTHASVHASAMAAGNNEFVATATRNQRIKALLSHYIRQAPEQAKAFMSAALGLDAEHPPYDPGKKRAVSRQLSSSKPTADRTGKIFEPPQLPQPLQPLQTSPSPTTAQAPPPSTPFSDRVYDLKQHSAMQALRNNVPSPEELDDRLRVPADFSGFEAFEIT